MNRIADHLENSVRCSTARFPFGHDGRESAGHTVRMSVDKRMRAEALAILTPYSR